MVCFSRFAFCFCYFFFFNFIFLLSVACYFLYVGVWMCVCVCVIFCIRQTPLNPWNESDFSWVLAPFLFFWIESRRWFNYLKFHVRSDHFVLSKICVSDVSSFVCRRIWWQDDDLGSLLIIAVVPLCHQPGSAIKIFAHTSENGFSRALSVSSIAKMSCRT